MILHTTELLKLFLAHRCPAPANILQNNVQAQFGIIPKSLQVIPLWRMEPEAQMGNVLGGFNLAAQALRPLSFLAGPTRQLASCCVIGFNLYLFYLYFTQMQSA